MSTNDHLLTVGQATTIRQDGGAKFVTHIASIRPGRHSFTGFDELTPYNAGRIVLFAVALAASSIAPAMAAPTCSLSLYCPQKIYTPPNFHIHCDSAVQFNQVSPAGTWTFLGYGQDWYGTTVLYHVVIEACLGLGPPAQTCTGNSIGVSQAQFCAPPSPPPPPGGKGGSAKACLKAGGTWVCGSGPAQGPKVSRANCSCEF